MATGGRWDWWCHLESSACVGGGARVAGQFVSASVLASGRGSRDCQVVGLVDQPADLMD